MRRRAWIAWGCLAAAIALALLGRVAPATDAWNLAAGLALLSAAGFGLSLLPAWGRLLPALPDFPDLFDRPRATERWCATCGHPAPRGGACRHCGGTPPSRRAARLGRG